MIKKIKVLKNFWIYQDFSWDDPVPSFNKFNLIYWWNWSWKTTISRIFSSIEKKTTDFPQYPENGLFEIENDDLTSFKNKDVENTNISVRVFNQDFIEENVSFNSSDYCNPIIHVSKVDIDTRKELDDLISKIPDLEKEYKTKEDYKKSCIQTEDTFRIWVAQIITQTLTNKKIQDRYFSYNKGRVKEKIDEVWVEALTKKLLTDEDKKRYENIISGTPKAEQRVMEKLIPINFDDLFQRTKGLLWKNVISELLERLKNPDDIDWWLDENLNTWVKQGFDIHKSRNQFNKCFFCDNPIWSSLFDSLSRHFSKDYDDLQDSIIYLIESLRKVKMDAISEKNIELYEDIATEYEEHTHQYNALVGELNNWLSKAEMWLEQKSKNPFDPDIPEMVDNPKDYITLLNGQIDKINISIWSHNIRVRNHSSEVTKAKENLELHHLWSAIKEQKYLEVSTNLLDAEDNEKIALEKLNTAKNRIKALEEKTSEISWALEEINTHLKEFFWRDEITLDLSPDKKWYSIYRQRLLAQNLSEGEKTAIAFSYFIVKTKEQWFDLASGIIFIDDPISSFDSNFIYHAFSLVKNSFEEVNQLFLSTHNFQFFNLAKDWFDRKNKNVEKNNMSEVDPSKHKPIRCNFYMLKGFYDSKGVRNAKIIELEKALKNNKSEYNFLFGLLKSFNENAEDPSFEEIYNIGNIGRRFFDIFIDFKIPDSSGQVDKLDKILKELNKDTEKVSQVQRDKLIWLLNWFSHNNNQHSSIEHTDKSEARAAIKILFDIVENSDPNHYRVLSEL